MTTICRVDERVRTNVDTARKWARCPLSPTHFSTTFCRAPDGHLTPSYRESAGLPNHLLTVNDGCV